MEKTKMSGRWLQNTCCIWHGKGGVDESPRSCGSSSRNCCGNNNDALW